LPAERSEDSRCRGRAHAVYGRPGAIGFAALIAVGLASVLLAYWRVENYV
jgi:hypothetical protein